MKIEPGRIMNDFIEPNKRQYIIPVYQRNYEWDREQCTPFRTKKYDMADVVSEENIFQILDGCLEEIENFEQDVAAKRQALDGALGQ